MALEFNLFGDHGMAANYSKLKTHSAGIGLIILAFSSLAAMSALPDFSTKEYTLPFLPESGKTVHLVFAGYPGCSTICPTSMALLKQVYTDLASEPAGTTPDVTFVNVELNTPVSVSKSYAMSWHQDFRGYSIFSDDAADIQKTLAVQAYADNQSSSAHLGYVYLFNWNNQAWNLTHAYAELPTLEELKTDVKALKPSYFSKKG